MAASNYGVVSFVKPPKLKNIDQPSIIKLESEYAVRKAIIDSINKDRDEDDQKIHHPSRTAWILQRYMHYA